MRTVVANYVDPDGLAILARKSGGWAWVERRDGRDVVIVNRSLAWVRKMCKSAKWIAP